VTTPATSAPARVAQPVLRQDLLLHRLDLRLGRLQQRLGLFVLGARNCVLDHQLAHARMVVAGFDQLCPRCCQLGARRLHAAFLVLRIQTCDQLAGPDGVTNVDGALDQAAVDAEGLVDLGLRLHRAGHGHRAAGRSLLNDDGTHRADLRSRRLDISLAGGQQGQPSERGCQGASGGQAASTAKGIHGHGQAPREGHKTIAAAPQYLRRCWPPSTRCQSIP
jgi:hypothetical protein